MCTKSWILFLKIITFLSVPIQNALHCICRSTLFNSLDMKNTNLLTRHLKFLTTWMKITNVCMPPLLHAHISFIYHCCCIILVTAGHYVKHVSPSAQGNYNARYGWSHAVCAMRCAQYVKLRKMLIKAEAGVFVKFWTRHSNTWQTLLK